MTHSCFSLPAGPSMVDLTWQWLNKYLLGEIDKQFQEGVVKIVYIRVETPLLY